MYRHVAVFELDGTFLGYAVMAQGAHKLQSTNLYAEDEGAELQQNLDRLNDSQAVQAAWPDARDPEVVALLAQRDFEPIEMHVTDVIDVDRSTLIYVKDVHGNDSLDLDENASTIYWKKAVVPVRPSDAVERTKKAMEVVARTRMTVTS